MTARYIPDNSAELAKEIAEAGLSSATISCADGADFDKIRIRPVALKTGNVLQAEQFRGTKAFHRNIDPASLAGELARIFGSGVRSAEFTLTRGAARTIKIMTNRRGEATVIRAAAPQKEAATESQAGATNPESAPHNRAKHYILEEGTPVPFLVDLGVMTGDGAVVKAKYDKFRQVNRFLEFIRDVVPELESIAANGKREITIVDFGCGKSYLTFAVYHYLSNVKKIPVRIIGLDLKEDVIADCSRLAERYGYGNLHFAVGDIANFTGCDRADMVITLHACDTATDYALAQAVRWNASVILSVPCCQHELNAQLAANAREDGTGAAPAGKVLEGAFKYGIIRERMAALLTDAMRAELLESAGYRTQILEFIDLSHTPKNLLIRAIRDRAGKDDASDNRKDESRTNGAYARLRDFLGADPTLGRILKSESGD